MNKKQFIELLASVKQMDEHARGKKVVGIKVTKVDKPKIRHDELRSYTRKLGRAPDCP